MTELHVDYLRLHPAGGKPTLIRRCHPCDDTLGSQARTGWATYSAVSAPHAMDECPFHEDDGESGGVEYRVIDADGIRSATYYHIRMAQVAVKEMKESFPEREFHIEKRFVGNWNPVKVDE